MSEAAQYVTRQEFDTVKDELERLKMAVEVLSTRVDIGFERVEDRFEQNEKQVDARFDRTERMILELKDIIQSNHTALTDFFLKR